MNLSVSTIVFVVLFPVANLSIGQCADEYEDNYGLKACEASDSISNFIENCSVTAYNSDQFIIHNFAAIPQWVIGTEDTIVATLNCLNDSITLTPVAYSVSSGYLSYSGFGKAYQDSIVLFLHQINPDYEHYYCSTYKRGITLGGSEVESKHDLISIFPNPSTGFMTIQGDISDLITLSILKIDGSWTRTIQENRRQIDISSMPIGIYILRLEYSDGFIQYKRVVKK